MCCVVMLFVVASLTPVVSFFLSLFFLRLFTCYRYKW